MLDTWIHFYKQTRWLGRPYSTAGCTNEERPTLGDDLAVALSRSDVAPNLWFYYVGIMMAMQIVYRVALYVSLGEKFQKKGGFTDTS